MPRFTAPLALLLASLASLPLAGCAGSDAALEDLGTGEGGAGGGTSSSGMLCVPGKVESCPCPGGEMGTQACAADGMGYEACECGGGSSSSSTGEPPDPCGDGVCIDADEDCHSCPLDCGTCAPCDIAPSCANAQIPPVAMSHDPSLDVALELMPKDRIAARLDEAIANAGPAVRVLAAALAPETRDENPLVSRLRTVFQEHPATTASLVRGLAKAGMDSPQLYANHFPAILPNHTSQPKEFPGGTMECGAPLLRLRVAQITVHEEDDDFANDIVYCAVVTEAAAGSEVRVTPQTPNLDEGDSFAFAIEAGVMWGQLGPTTPGGNMLITYDCFEADTNDGYQSLIDSIGSAAGDIGGVVGGQYGWVFTVVGALAPVVSGALALDGDDHLFNATQTIPLDKQLDMTNGRFWGVRKSGTHNLSDWDWELRVEAWGCAEYGTL